MIKRLALIFGAIFILGILYYLFTAATAALSVDGNGYSFFGLPSLVPASPFALNRAAGVLTTVDFDKFGKNGPGWRSVTEGYGNTPYSYMYFDHWHNGIDIAAAYDAAVLSPAAGEIVAAGDQDDFCPHIAFGRFVVMYDPVARAILMFAHLDRILVSPGQQVAKGAEVATVGATGRETGVHLHFSVYKIAGFSMAPAHGCGPYPQGNDIDPVPYLEGLTE